MFHGLAEVLCRSFGGKMSGCCAGVGGVSSTKIGAVEGPAIGVDVAAVVSVVSAAADVVSAAADVVSAAVDVVSAAAEC
ncbi:unnamed protein product [Closterium sp. Naga37s-1]|nr:unnamed protein product [Closterium sp. Naga37s-1]